MSYKFSVSSLSKLQTCHPDIQLIMKALIKHFDFTVIYGSRGEATQNELFAQGKSKLMYPDSKHNLQPSMAIDIAPYPIDWEDLSRFYYMAGMIEAIGLSLRAKGMISHGIRWGGSWNGGHDFKANKFNDLGHFELV